MKKKKLIKRKEQFIGKTEKRKIENYLKNREKKNAVSKGIL